MVFPTQHGGGARDTCLHTRARLTYQPPSQAIRAKALAKEEKRKLAKEKAAKRAEDKVKRFNKKF